MLRARHRHRDNGRRITVLPFAARARFEPLWTREFQEAVEAEPRPVIVMDNALQQLRVAVDAAIAVIPVHLAAHVTADEGSVLGSAVAALASHPQTPLPLPPSPSSVCSLPLAATASAPAAPVHDEMRPRRRPREEDFQLFPHGRVREPLAALLARCDAAIVHDASGTWHSWGSDSSGSGSARGQFNHTVIGTRTDLDACTVAAVDCATGVATELGPAHAAFRGRDIVAFSGLGDATGFVDTLAAWGPRSLNHVELLDHATITARFARRVCKMAAAAHGDASARNSPAAARVIVATTAKDAHRRGTLDALRGAGIDSVVVVSQQVSVVGHGGDDPMGHFQAALLRARRN
jgi:hypothetical protein